MQDYSINPYQKAIDNAKSRRPELRNMYTQERIAEEINRAVATVKNYCYGITRPEDEIVEILARYLDAPDLAREHLYYWEPLVRKYFPKVEARTLSEAAIEIDIEIEEFVKHIGELKKIARDNKITEDEKAPMEDIRAAARRIRAAIDELEISTQGTGKEDKR